MPTLNSLSTQDTSFDVLQPSYSSAYEDVIVTPLGGGRPLVALSQPSRNVSTEIATVEPSVVVTTGNTIPSNLPIQTSVISGGQSSIVQPDIINVIPKPVVSEPVKTLTSTANNNDNPKSDLIKKDDVNSNINNNSNVTTIKPKTKLNVFPILLAGIGVGGMYFLFFRNKN